MLKISTVTPVYCGAPYLANLVEELERERKNWKLHYPGLELVESIFVLDDPIDNSAEELRSIQKNYEWVKIITLSNNSGQHAATMAGILYSVGDWIFTIDEDLQHRPKHFITFLNKAVSTTTDICYAYNKNATHNSFIRDRCSSLFKRIIGKILGNKNIKYFNSFRLIRGEIGRSASAIAGHDAYFDILLSWYSNKLQNVEIDLTDIRNANSENKSGYSFLGLLKHAKRMIFTSNIKILRVGILIGLMAFIMSILIFLYSLLAVYVYQDPDINRGWYSTFSSILFFGGLNSLLIGLLLESISHILLHIQGKPTFYQIDRSSDKLLANILNTEILH